MFLKYYLDNTSKTEFLVNKDFSIGESNFTIKMADLFYIMKNKDKKLIQKEFFLNGNKIFLKKYLLKLNKIFKKILLKC